MLSTKNDLLNGPYLDFTYAQHDPEPRLAWTPDQGVKYLTSWTIPGLLLSISQESEYARFLVTELSLSLRSLRKEALRFGFS